ncbi:MAG: membrane protein insertase YidC [Bacteroidales bacterium]|nr:membrane protein insertase YidC [Bacteroidales bacterium]
MDKNTIIGFLLIAALLFGYSWLAPKEEVENVSNTPTQTVEATQSATIEENLVEEVIDSVALDLKQKSKYGPFSTASQGESKKVTLSNNLVELEFDTKGGILSKATLKEYSRYDSLPVVLFDETDNNFGFIFKPAGRVVYSKDLFFTPQATSDSTLIMTLTTDEGSKFNIEYTLPSNSYMVNVQVMQEGMDKVLPQNLTNLDFVWEQKLRSQEKGRMFEERNSALYYKRTGAEVDNLAETGEDLQNEQLGIKWIGFKNQFFSSVLIADSRFNGAQLYSRAIEKDSTYLKIFKAETSFEYNSTANEGPSFKMFLGPNLYPLLKSYDSDVEEADELNLDELVSLGWTLFRWINTYLIIPIFTFLGKYIGNYGLIIFLLTIIIKIIILPLTYKSYMSTAKIRVLRPQIDAINEKYPGKEKALERQRATMELYSKAGASPMSGCLPMLLQMPILIAVFAFFPSSIELRGESFLWADDLSAYDAILTWEGDIPIISWIFGNHLSLFCLLMTVTNIIYTKINMENQASGSQMPGMKWLMYLMPIMFLVFFNNYASGLSYYYFVSLLITILQTYAFRKFINEEKVLAKLKENQKKPRKKSGFMARLEEAQKRQEAMMRERAKQQGRR